MSVRQRPITTAREPRRKPDAPWREPQWHEPGWSQRPGAPRARLVHHVPGRLRIRFDGVDDREFFDALHDILSGFPGVSSVRVNPAASSAVVWYDPERHPGFAGGIEANTALQHLLDESGVGENWLTEEELLAHGMTYLERHSQLAEAIVSSAERLDRDLRRVTDGYLDLKMLFPLTMAAFSTLHKARAKGTPMWMTLCTFAFNSFMALHRNRLDGPSPKQLARARLAAR